MDKLIEKTKNPINHDVTELRHDPNGCGTGCAWPPRRYYIKLPSGMRHWFETEEQARFSGYWPH